MSKCHYIIAHSLLEVYNETRGGGFEQDQCCTAFKYNSFSVVAFSLKLLSEAGGVCHLCLNSSKDLMTLVDITVQSLLL